MRRLRRRQGLRLLYLGLALAGHDAPVAAAVSGSELVTTCRAALSHGYVGPEAAMCDWFVNPCGVCGVDDGHPRWCVPDTLSGAPLATLVVEALEADPGALGSPVKPFVAEFLRARFPCPAVSR
jgi:hypothetical protein